MENTFTFDQIRKYMDSPDTDWTQDLAENVYAPNIDEKDGVYTCTALRGGPVGFKSRAEMLIHLRPLMTSPVMRRFVDDLEEFWTRNMKANGWSLRTFAFGNVYAMVFLAPPDKQRRKSGERVLLCISEDAMRVGWRHSWEHEYDFISRKQASTL